MTFIERCSFLLLLVSMMGMLCKANHTGSVLIPGFGSVQPSVCIYERIYTDTYCKLHDGHWKHYYSKNLGYAENVSECLLKVMGNHFCTKTMTYGASDKQCMCLKKDRECIKRSKTGDTVYTISCSKPCEGKCSETHMYKDNSDVVSNGVNGVVDHMRPDLCHTAYGGVCNVNDQHCCVQKECKGCDDSPYPPFYYPLAQQNPSGCNGHCPINDGHCCGVKECGACAPGWYAKSHPAPWNCPGSCPYNSPECCAAKECQGCTGAYFEKNSKNPHACNGQCTVNDSNCCHHAPKSLIHKNTHAGDFDITELFELSFSITPYQTRSGLANVLQMTETSDGQGSGGKLPAVYFHPGTLKLKACTECDGNTNSCITSDHLTAYTNYEVMIEMAEETFSIYINDEKVASRACVEKHQPATGAVGTLWMSSPWGNPAYAHVEQVEYKRVHQATVTGWQPVEHGMSCTSHRLLAGTGISEADCKALCEANAMCHSIFFSTEGLRSCTLCPSYSPGPAIKLDNTTYVDHLNTYKMAYYRRPHLMDVQWYHGPIFSCEDEGFYDGLRILTKQECLRLATENGQTTLNPSPFLASGCAMSQSGEIYWTDEDPYLFPEDTDVWNELLICKFEPENNNLDLFPTSTSPDFPQATDGDVLTHSVSQVEAGKNFVEIDIDGELSLMKLWIAKATDNHVQHGHTCDHTGTAITVLAYNGFNYVPCAEAKLNPRKQWTQVVCNTALHAQKIRIESTEHAFAISDTRIFGITSTRETYLAKYPWTSEISDDWHTMDDHRGCFGADETTSVGTYRTLTCIGSHTKCVSQAQSTCNDEWRRCWGIGLKVYHLTRWTIEFYDAQAMDPMKCTGLLGLKEDSKWTTLRRRALQLYDVMENKGPCWLFNWFSGNSTLSDWCDGKEWEFAVEAIAVLQSLRECTVKESVDDIKACYREMAARDVIGYKMYNVLADRKDDTRDCVDDRRRAPDWVEARKEEEETQEGFGATMRRRLAPAVDLAKYGGSKTRAYLAMIMKHTPHPNDTRRAELEYEHFEPSSTYGQPRNRRRFDSDDCWRKANMLDAVACENLKDAADIALDVMKSRRGIAQDRVSLHDRQTGLSVFGGVGGLIAGLVGGRSTYMMGGAGMALGVASQFVSGFTNLFCGFGDGVNAQSERVLAQREARAIQREIGAQEMRALSERVQVCEMPSTGEIKCLLGDMKEDITEEMKAGFDALGSQVQNVLRVLDDNHNQVLREFVKVESLLVGHSIELANLREQINMVLHQATLNTNLIFWQERLGAIEEAQRWYRLWTEEDETTRLDNFKNPQGAFWCEDLVKKIGSTLLPGYISEWVASDEFKVLAKPPSCTPDGYAERYTLHHKSFEALFEFVAMMQLYINEYSGSTVTALDHVRVEMAETFQGTLKEIEALPSC